MKNQQQLELNPLTTPTHFTKNCKLETLLLSAVLYIVCLFLFQQYNSMTSALACLLP